MKILLSAIIMSTLTIHANSSIAKGFLSLADEAAEGILRLSGKYIDDTTRLAMRNQLRKAALKYGDDAIIAARKGGVELMQAAAKHGDDVLKYAAKHPQAATIIARDPETYLKLCRAYGDDILRLETKAVGLASSTAHHFGKDGVKMLARQAPAEHISKLNFMATHCKTPATKKILLKQYATEGIGLFNRINRKSMIVGGLTVAMIVGADGLADGAREIANGIGKGIEKIGEKSPGQLGKVIEDSFSFITLPIKVMGFIIAAWLFLKLGVFRLIKEAVKRPTEKTLRKN